MGAIGEQVLDTDSAGSSPAPLKTKQKLNKYFVLL
jgi:hypothetical protein